LKVLKVFSLRSSRHWGLLAGLVHGVGQVVTAPVAVAGAAVKVGGQIAPTDLDGRRSDALPSAQELYSWFEYFRIG
jgi:hypothetical protein